MHSTFPATADRQAGVGIHHQLLIAAYVIAIILFNREGGLLLAIPKILAPLIAFAFLIQILGYRCKIHIPMTYRIWALWFVVAITSTLLSDDVRLSRIITIAQLALLGFFITNFLIWNRDTRFYIIALIAGVTASVLWIHLDPAAVTQGGRVRGTIGNANAHGVLLSVGLVLSVVMGLGAKHWFPKLSLLALAVWLFIAILRTGSRQAIIGGVVVGGCVVLGVYLYRSWFAKDGSFARLLLISAAALPVVVTSIITSEFWYRIDRAATALGGDIASDNSLRERLWMIQRGVELWADRPIIGHGMQAFSSAAEADHVFASSIGGYAHNNYIELLVATGLLGLLIYVSIYVYWLGKLYFLRHSLMRRELFGPYAIVVAVVVITILADVARVSHYEKLFWLLLPWVAAELYLLENKIRLKSDFKPRSVRKYWSH
jgi:O-antigen ligase